MTPRSKTALLELRSEYEVAGDGEEILEQKRNILLQEIMLLIEEVENKRKRLDELIAKSYRQLIKAFMENGIERVEQESGMIRQEAEIETLEKTFVGVVVPEVRFRKSEKTLPVSYASESLYLDIARLSFLRATELILELSSIEIKVWRLARELRKTVVRVNALKNYYLPKYRREIRQIETSLAESEREFLSVLKHLSDR